MLPPCSPKNLEALQAFYYPATLEFVLNTSSVACCQPAAPKCWKPCKPSTTLLFLKFVLNTSSIACCQPAAPKCWKPCKPSTTLLLFEVCLEHFISCMLPGCSPKMLEAQQAFCYPATLKFVLNTSTAACCQPAAPKCWERCNRFTTLLF